MTGTAKDQACLHSLGEALGLNGDLLLVLSRQVDKLIVLGSNQERNSGLVEPSALAVPFLDRVQSTLPSQIEHEENRNGIIADQRKHVDKLTLTTEIPDGEGNLSIAN